MISNCAGRFIKPSPPLPLLRILPPPHLTTHMDPGPSALSQAELSYSSEEGHSPRDSSQGGSPSSSVGHSDDALRGIDQHHHDAHLLHVGFSDDGTSDGGDSQRSVTDSEGDSELEYDSPPPVGVHNWPWQSRDFGFGFVEVDASEGGVGPEEHGLTLLQFACKRGRCDIAEALMRHSGIRANDDLGGWPPALFFAYRSPQPAAFFALVSNPNVDLNVSDGESCRHFMTIPGST